MIECQLILMSSEITLLQRLEQLQALRNDGYQIIHQGALSAGGLYFYLEKRTHEPHSFPVDDGKPDTRLNY